MADNTDNSDSLASRKDLKCKECSSTLGSISPDGYFEPRRKDGRSCDTCRLFEELHAAMLAADEAWEQNRHRRPNYGGRVDALEGQRNAHKAFANFLLQLEQTNPATTEDSLPNKDHDEERKRGEKRPRSPSSSQSHSRSPKRPRPSKRVSFDQTGNFVDESEYRDSHSFQRETETYVRGRNAAPEGGEYLDTSGHDQEYKDFHSLKWVGRKWVSVVESDEEEDGAEPNLQDTEAAKTEGDEAEKGGGGSLSIDDAESTNRPAIFETTEVPATQEEETEDTGNRALDAEDTPTTTHNLPARPKEGESVPDSIVPVSNQRKISQGCGSQG